MADTVGTKMKVCIVNTNANMGQASAFNVCTTYVKGATELAWAAVSREAIGVEQALDELPHEELLAIQLANALWLVG